VKKYLLLFIPLLLGQTLAVSQTAKIDSSNLRKLRIDPASAVGFPARELYSDIKYISLETIDKSQFGNIQKLEVADDRFIIFDGDTRDIFIFSNTGKFIDKITQRSVAKLNGMSSFREGSVFNGFVLTKLAGVNYIEIGVGADVLQFNMNGGYLKKLPYKDNSVSINLKDGTKIIPAYNKNKKHYFEFAIVNPKGDTATYWPFSLQLYDEDDFIIQSTQFDKAANEEEVLYYRYYSYDVFSINASGVSLKYRIVLPSSISLPADFATNPIYKLKKWPYLKINKNAIYGLKNVWQIGDYLYMTFSAFSRQMSNKYTLAYNLKTNQLISLQNITPDETSSFLPINDSAIGTNFLTDGFLTFDGKNLYTVISGLSFKGLKNQVKTVGSNIPTVLKNVINNDKATANPTIVVLTPKVPN